MANKKECRTKPFLNLSNSGFPKYSTNNIVYQGETNKCLTICTNSSLTSVLEVLMEDLCIINTYVNKDNYEICEAIEKELIKDYNFKDLFQVVLNRSCSVEQMKKDIEFVLGDTRRIVLNLKCLKDRVDNDNCQEYTPLVLRTILQLLIDAHCDLKSEFDDLKSNINSYIDNQINIAINNLNITDSIPIGTVFVYNGNMSLFNSSGLGTGSMSKYAIANGANGTKDYRGFVLVGEQHNGLLPLDAITSSTSYTLDDKGGTPFMTLSVSNLPSHSHSATISNPTGNIQMDVTSVGGAGVNSAFLRVPSTNIQTYNQSVTLNPPTVTINNAGGSSAFDNRMPYKAVMFIQKIA